MKLDYLKYLCSADRHLAEIIKNVGSYSIKTRNDSYLSLIEAIIYQQLTGKAASTIYDRFMEYFGGTIPGPLQILSSAEIELRAKVGLSRMKVAYLKDLAAHVADGRLNLNNLPAMKDEDVITQLVKVKGIGRWTAEMFLIFCLDREDVLPVTDLGLRNAMKRTYLLNELPKPDKMIEIANPWRPYRSIATWYMWKSLSNFNTIG